MKILRVGKADFLDPFYDFFVDVIKDDYQLVHDDVSPQLLLFGDKNFGNSNLRYDPSKVFKLFYTGENEHFWQYQCHAGITFDHINHPMHYRLPLYVTHSWDYTRSGVIKHYNFRLDNNWKFSSRMFCSFVVKNPGCQTRNDFFHKLNAIDPVASGGPLFNNIGGLVGGDFSVKSKLDFIGKYKFNICYENASHPGYVTEKLYQAMLGGTVPIYWGCPVVDHDFNKKAFINRSDFNTDEEMIKEIIRIRDNWKAWIEMLAEPMFSTTKYFDMNRLKHWLRSNIYPMMERHVGL